MSVKPVLMIDGEKYPANWVSYTSDGKVDTVQILKGYQFISYVDINSTVEGAEKIDFSRFYIEENNEVENNLSELITSTRDEFNRMAHAAIPNVDGAYSEQELRSDWLSYHLKKAYLDGLQDSLKIVVNK